MKIKAIIFVLLLGLLSYGCTPQKQTGGSASNNGGSDEAKLKEPEAKATMDASVVLPPAPGLSKRPDVAEFIGYMVQKYGFNQTKLLDAFNQAGFQPSILDAMSKPYEAKPWYQYRKLFMTEKRINGGKAFLADNQSTLAKASSRYGVPPDMITAIIGIESAYGVKPGKYRLIDSLSTLAFDYPRRASFFRGELEQFLLLCREESLDYLSPQGSYAGAMGMPQFMPSSYRKLAVDGDGDGKRDIWKNPADAVASVANYFSRNGWHTGEPIAVQASVTGEKFAGLVSRKNPKASYTMQQLQELGITPKEHIPAHLKAGLLELQGETGPMYWITFHNFNVIMRYNHSPLYAMAAYELTRQFRGY